MARLIKKYENRKLYDTEAKQYVSLQDIGALIRQGHKIVVTDNATGKDLTAQTLSKLIADSEESGRRVVPPEVLHDLVRWGEKLMSAGRGQFQSRIDRLVFASLERVAPVEEIRNEVARLNEQVRKLEALVGKSRKNGPEPEKSGQ
jgi:polyhydroxyalkanoate synthesis repressor PhaR